MTSQTTRHEPEWYGVDAAFWYPLERGSTDHFAAMRAKTPGEDRLQVIPGHEILTYRVTGMYVPGDPERHDITVEFYRHPPYPTGGLDPRDYPRITTSVDRPYYHQHGRLGPFQGALCLWRPDALVEKRWISSMPLYELFEMVRRHLLMEEFHRRHKRWLMPDMPHPPKKAA